MLFAKCDLDHLRLGGIAERRGRRMSVHIADVGRLDAGVLQRHLHRPGRALARRIGLSHVRSVRRDAVPDQLGVDARTARACMLELLQDDHRGSFAHDEPVSLLVEGPRRLFGVVVAARQRAHGIESRYPDLSDRRLCPSGKHHVGAADADLVHRVADRHVRRGARGALAHQRALRPELDRHPSGAHVRNDRRDRERADAVRPAGQKHVVALLVALQAADAGGDRGAEPVGRRRDVHARVGLRLACRSEDHLGEAVHPPRRLAIDPDRRVEILQLAGEVDVVIRVIERRDLCGARLAREQARPRRLHIVSERADHAQAGDHDSSHFPLTFPTRRR